MSNIGGLDSLISQIAQHTFECEVSQNQIDAITTFCEGVSKPVNFLDDNVVIFCGERATFFQLMHCICSQMVLGFRVHAICENSSSVFHDILDIFQSVVSLKEFVFFFDRIVEIPRVVYAYAIAVERNFTFPEEYTFVSNDISYVDTPVSYVFSSADYYSAAEMICKAVFSQDYLIASGIHIVLVEESIYQQFRSVVEEIINRGKYELQVNLTDGDQRLIDVAIQQGSQFFSLNPKCFNGVGVWYDAPPPSPLFGSFACLPHLLIEPVRTVKEALSIASEYIGSQASIWTENISLALDAVSYCKSSNIYINGLNTQYDCSRGFPLGGVTVENKINNLLMPVINTMGDCVQFSSEKMPEFTEIKITKSPQKMLASLLQTMEKSNCLHLKEALLLANDPIPSTLENVDNMMHIRKLQLSKISTVFVQMTNKSMLLLWLVTAILARWESLIVDCSIEASMKHSLLTADLQVNPIKSVPTVDLTYRPLHSKFFISCSAMLQYDPKVTDVTFIQSVKRNIIAAANIQNVNIPYGHIFAN